MSQLAVDEFSYPTPRVEWLLDGSGSFQRALYERVLDKLIDMRDQGRIHLVGDEHQKSDGRFCRKYVFWLNDEFYGFG
jgi:hypothetical protein